MITSLRKRPRPDNLVNQVRTGGKSAARRLYLLTLGAAAALVGYQLMGPMLFLDADGMARRNTHVVATDFVGRVEQVLVKPGDSVRAGDIIAVLQSHDSTGRLAELGARIVTIEARRSQLDGRLRSLEQLLPSAEERLARAKATLAKVADLNRRNLITAARFTELNREAFEAEKEVTQLMGEGRAVRDELDGVRRNLAQIETLDRDLRAAYDGGRVIATVGGTIGARVALPGTVVSRGQPIAEIHHGDVFVTAFVPHGRFYELDRGDHVFVSDGVNRRAGRIARVERVSDQLPQEFQSTLKSIERHQLMRIALNEGDAPFAVPSKVRITGRYSPSAVVSLAREAVAVAYYAGARLDDRLSEIDLSGVASLRPARNASASSPTAQEGLPTP